VSAPVGLIAGLGQLPVEIARSVRRRGRPVVAAALRELADPGLAKDVDRMHWVHLGALEETVALFRESGVREVVWAGKVPKTFLWQRRELVRPDRRALAVLSELRDRKDDSLLGALASALEAEGFALRGQGELAPELWAPEGTLGRVQPTAAQLADVVFGWPFAKAIAALDVGQAVVVQGGAVLALEAIEGTDEAIRRGCSLGEPGACVVKVAKPQQDPRFDVPAIGLDTIRILAEGAASTLAVEAGRTLVLQREAMLAEADACGIALVGASEESLAREVSG
jgi:UDP-2,3-diacylglucosamine hydrolase